MKEVRRMLRSERGLRSRPRELRNRKRRSEGSSRKLAEEQPGGRERLAELACSWTNVQPCCWARTQLQERGVTH